MSFLKQRSFLTQWLRRSIAAVMFIAILIGVLFTQTELVLCVHADGQAGIELGMGGQCADWASALKPEPSFHSLPDASHPIPHLQKRCHDIVLVSQGHDPLEARSIRSARYAHMKDQERRQATQIAFWQTQLIAQSFAQLATTAMRPQPPPPLRPPHHRLLRGVILLI
jgi:hypothetical protein